jgi:hypothetical protein
MDRNPMLLLRGVPLFRSIHRISLDEVILLNGRLISEGAKVGPKVDSWPVYKSTSGVVVFF